MKYIRAVLLSAWLLLSCFAVCQTQQPYSFVNIGGSYRIAWNYPFQVSSNVAQNTVRWCDQYANIQACINDCPGLSGYHCLVVVPGSVSDTTDYSGLVIPTNVAFFDWRPKASLGDGNTLHFYIGSGTTNHGMELGVTGGSNNGGEGPTLIGWNVISTACGASTCPFDATSSAVLSHGPTSARIYSLVLHGGWWDGSAWHPDPDLQTNTGKTATAQPGTSTQRWGATQAILFNPATTSVTSQLDPEIAETNGWLYGFNERSPVGGQAFLYLGRNYNWNVMPQKWGGTFANSATDPPSSLATLAAGGGTWLDFNCAAANNVCIKIRDSNGAGGVTHSIFTTSAAEGAMSFMNSGGTPKVTIAASSNGQIRAGDITGPIVVSFAAPAISSGFGTSPSVNVATSTASFSINVGTGGAATSGVIGLPTTTNGWSCACADITTQSATVFVTKQTASSASSCTVGNFNTAGAAAAWVASDILSCSAFGR